MKNNNILGSRILSGAVIIALGLVLIYAGGWIYTAGLGVFLSIAIWEYVRLFEKGGYPPLKPS
jgi:CDP-diglyceride synthetase